MDYWSNNSTTVLIRLWRSGLVSNSILYAATHDEWPHHLLSWYSTVLIIVLDRKLASGVLDLPLIKSKLGIF
jgi:hypothetical protein